MEKRNEGLIPGVVPDGVTDELIQQADRKGLKNLAAKFNPPISTKNCVNVEEMRERLRCGMKRARGTMYDLSHMSKLMSDLKVSDENYRCDLIKLFTTINDALQGLSEQDTKIHDQLQKEDITKDFTDKITDFENSLRQEECRIVIAGQTSSGKSTLMNLFLGEDILPSEILSCTATICELAYGDEKAAQIIYADGRTQNIPFQEKEKYIYKESERERRFDHDIVRLYLPVPFLKSGIILVDTPGVGENSILEDLLLEYVAKTEVFGFIFVIKCNDSGGVLQRFKDLLRQLADIRDNQKQNKFDPKSVIFVANFWDKVPQSEKEATKQVIEGYLTKEAFMKTFDPKRQIFYMNSKFAIFSLQVGLISEDYECLMKGIEVFFPVGHKRKLKLAYVWLELILLKILHPVKVYLNKARQSCSSLNDKESQLVEKLSMCDNDIEAIKQHLQIEVESKRSELVGKMLNFLKTETTAKAFGQWSVSELPKEEYGDNWALIEEKIESAIDKKISKVLQNWEDEKKHFASVEASLTSKILLKMLDIKTSVMEVETELRNLAGEAESADHALKLKQRYIEDRNETREGRKLKVEFIPEYTLNSEQDSLINRLLFHARSFRLNDRQREIKEQSKKYSENKEEYMQNRTEMILNVLQNSEQVIKQLVDDNLNPVHESILATIKKVKQGIKANKELIKNVFQDGRKGHQIVSIYQPHENSINDIFDQALLFKNKCLIEYEYPTGSLKNARELGRMKSHSSENDITCLFSTIGLKTEEGPITGNISVKYFKAKSDHGAALEPRHMFYMMRNLRNVSRHKNILIPFFLGLHESGPGEQPSFVFRGKLISARSHFLARSPDMAMEQKNIADKAFRQEIRVFLDSLGEALQFLHLKKFVHLELTLDGVCVDADRNFQVMLTNILEPLDVPYPQKLSLKVGNYIYMAPETFPVKAKQDRRYTSASDIYALGLLVLELCSKKDVFADLKTSMDIAEFIKKPDQGKFLLDKVKDADSHLNDLYPLICLSQKYIY